MTTSLVDSHDEDLAGQEEQGPGMALVAPSAKARLLFATTPSLQIDKRFFDSHENILKLVKFLKRTTLIDVSLTVLSVHFANLHKEAHLCGKLVFNQLAQFQVQSVLMLAHSIKPDEMQVKDLLVVKNLVHNSLRREGKESESDFEFLRISPVEVSGIPEDPKFELSNEVKHAGVLDDEAYLDLLGKKLECYRYVQEASSSESGAAVGSLQPRDTTNKLPSKIRRETRLEMDFKRIGTDDDFSDYSHISQASLSRYFPSKPKRRTLVDFETMSSNSTMTMQPQQTSKRRQQVKRSSEIVDPLRRIARPQPQPRQTRLQIGGDYKPKKTRQSQQHQSPQADGGYGRRSKSSRLRQVSQPAKWRPLQYYYGQSVGQLNQNRPLPTNRVNRDNILNSLFCQEANPARQGKLAAAQKVDAYAFVTDPKQLARLASFSLNYFTESFTKDKCFKSSLETGIMSLQNQINFEGVKEEMETKGIDLESLDQFRMACQDFVDHFKAKLTKRNANSKMLNVSFAVLFVFLKCLEDSNKGDGTIADDFKQVICSELVTEFFQLLGEASWEILSCERETQLLISSILTRFLLKHGIASDQALNLFRYILDMTLCRCILRVIDWDIQRMLMKREARFSFLAMSFLGVVHESIALEHSLFSEIVNCAQRFRDRMQKCKEMPDSFDEWLHEQKEKERDEISQKVVARPTGATQSVTDVYIYAVLIQVAIVRANQTLVKGPQVTIDWPLFTEMTFSADHAAGSSSVGLSEISLHLVSQMQSETPLDKDSLIGLLSRSTATPIFSHEKIKRVLKDFQLSEGKQEQDLVTQVCLSTCPVLKILHTHLTMMQKEEKTVKQLYAKLTHSLQKSNSELSLWMHLLFATFLSQQANIIFLKALDTLTKGNESTLVKSIEKQATIKRTTMITTMIIAFGALSKSLKQETCEKFHAIVNVQVTILTQLHEAQTNLTFSELQMKLDQQFRAYKQQTKSIYLMLKRFTLLSNRVEFTNADTLAKLTVFVGNPAIRQDILGKTLKYWLLALCTITANKDIKSDSVMVQGSQDIDMVSAADLEACLLDEGEASHVSSQSAQVDNSHNLEEILLQLKSLAFIWLRHGRDKEVTRLIFKAFGQVSGSLSGQTNASAAQNFMQQVKSLESQEKQGAISSAQLTMTSTPMFLAHCLASFFRGYVSHCEQIADLQTSYILVECLVRTLLDKADSNEGLKLYQRVKKCRLTLRTQLETDIWHLFTSAEISLQTEDHFTTKLAIFKDFFSKVKQRREDKGRSYDIVYQYVALIPLLIQGQSDPKYIHFLKELMLALIVGFQEVITLRNTKLSDFIQSLRAQLLPRTFTNQSSLQVQNRMLLLSDEAIYVFEYLALMREPANDYLNSILNHVNSNIDSLVPSYVLELTQKPSAEVNLAELFNKISKSGHVSFFAQMLTSLTHVRKEKDYLCAVLLLILVVSACKDDPALISAAQTFLVHQACKLDQPDQTTAIFDTKTNLNMLAYLQLSEVCFTHAVSSPYDSTSVDKICLKVLQSQQPNHGYGATPIQSCFLERSSLKFQLTDASLIERLIYRNIKQSLLRCPRKFIAKTLGPVKDQKVAGPAKTHWEELYRDTVDSCSGVKLRTLTLIEDLFY